MKLYLPNNQLQYPVVRYFLLHLTFCNMHLLIKWHIGQLDRPNLALFLVHFLCVDCFVLLLLSLTIAWL